MRTVGREYFYGILHLAVIWQSPDRDSPYSRNRPRLLSDGKYEHYTTHNDQLIRAGERPPTLP